MLLFFMVGNTSTTVWIVLPPSPFSDTDSSGCNEDIWEPHPFNQKKASFRSGAPFLGSLASLLGRLALGELSVSDHFGSMLLSTHIKRVRISSKSLTMNQRNFIPLLSEFLLYLDLFLVSTLSFYCRAGAETQTPSPTTEEEQELLADPDTIPSSQR